MTTRNGRDAGVVPASDYPTIVNRWHEFLGRMEYLFSRDQGVDIMKLWMGDVETPVGGPNFNSSIGTSVGYKERKES